MSVTIKMFDYKEVKMINFYFRGWPRESEVVESYNADNDSLDILIFIYFYTQS